MRNILLFLVFVACSIQLSAQTTITIMDSVIFYDGYAGIVTNPPPPAGILMHKNSLFARKLTGSELLSIGDSLQMNIVISALCDNYDRIGNVNMALVPKGSAAYSPDTVDRIELGRFITPFFNKNIQPDTVPYTFNISNITMLLRDKIITSTYDIWIELELFGVPYAANTQVAGCAGRNDVFMGKLQFVTNSLAQAEFNNFLLPLFFKNRYNNYQANATDSIGMTIKSTTFNLPEDVTDAALYLITSNHGANAGGEEYNRRDHFVYFDNNQVLTYKPGRLTCEPFRHYNTQPNGIFGSTPKTPAQWQAFSNWCPGDVIDIRKINLDTVAAGDHTFLIQVPDAVFVGMEGNFPLSLYLQGKTAYVPSGITNSTQSDHRISIYPNPTSGHFTVELLTTNAELLVTDVHGKQIIKTQMMHESKSFQLDNNGVYFVFVKTNEGVVTRKVIVNR